MDLWIWHFLGGSQDQPTIALRKGKPKSNFLLTQANIQWQKFLQLIDLISHPLQQTNLKISFWIISNIMEILQTHKLQQYIGLITEVIQTFPL